MLMVDTGVRRKELCDLNWGDVKIGNGMVTIREGKGGKARSVVIGIKTRRALLKYRKKIEHASASPLFQTVHGNRFTFPGLRSCLLRISERADIHASPHIFRRTFATLSLRSGMNPLHLQGLLGHSSLEMTRRYVSMVDNDLLEAHKAFGPIDNL
jgi:integrase/recombinase XerD